MMKRICCFLVVVIASFACPDSFLHAQSTGTITGTVIDSSGAVVSGASLTVTDETTNLSRSAQSDAKGQYALRLLQPSLYTLDVEAKGFKKFERQHIELLVD